GKRKGKKKVRGAGGAQRAAPTAGGAPGGHRTGPGPRHTIVDPKIIDGWAFSGWDGGDLGHTWRITACQQEKPWGQEAGTGRCRAKPSGLTTNVHAQMSAVREQRWPEPGCHAWPSLPQSLS